MSGACYALARHGRTAAAAGLAIAALAATMAWIAMNGLQLSITAAIAAPQSSVLAQRSLWDLFISGLKAGLLTFGGAYTVIPFLQEDAVSSGGWMTNPQFMDGLALSSRNQYLDEEQRRRAPAIAHTLFAAQRAARYGADAAIGEARHQLRHARGVDLDYLELTDPDLGPAPESGPARLLIAARVGPTRLIDNVPLVLNGDS